MLLQYLTQYNADKRVALKIRYSYGHINNESFSLFKGKIGFNISGKTQEPYVVRSRP